MLDKRVLPLCKSVNERSDKIVLRIFSNGSTLTPQNIEAIANLKRVSYLWVSLNSHIPEEYERLMGLNFEQTTKKLDYLHEVYARGEFPHQVMLSCVGHPNEPFRRYCYHRWPHFNSMAIKKDAWIDYTEAQCPEVPDTPCSRWFELSITSQGNAVTCCMDDGTNPAYYIGNVNTQTLYEIYNAPRWRERREKLLSRKQLDDTSPCARCSY
jgi:radical SAM protein with 4Fe4S-binding SPASM domain